MGPLASGGQQALVEIVCWTISLQPSHDPVRVIPPGACNKNQHKNLRSKMQTGSQGLASRSSCLDSQPGSPSSCAFFTPSTPAPAARLYPPFHPVRSWRSMEVGGASLPLFAESQETPCPTLTQLGQPQPLPRAEQTPLPGPPHTGSSPRCPSLWCDRERWSLAQFIVFFDFVSGIRLAVIRWVHQSWA